MSSPSIGSGPVYEDDDTDEQKELRDQFYEIDKDTGYKNLKGFDEEYVYNRASTTWSKEVFTQYLDTLQGSKSMRHEKGSDKYHLLAHTCRTFLRFYTGHVTNASTLIQVALTLFANIGPKDENLIGDHPILETSQDITSATYAFKAPAEVNPHRFTAERVSVELGDCKESINLWNKELSEIIERKHRPKELISADDRLEDYINYCAFLLLNLFRYWKKDAANTTTHIVVQAPKSFESLFTVSSIPFIPPHYEKPRLLKRYLSPDGSDAKGLLAIIVHAYMETQSIPIRGILSAGCLLSLSENGLGAISWGLKGMYSVRPAARPTYFRMLRTGEYMGSAALVESFIRKDKGERPYAWAFARLFEPGAMMEYSIQNHKPYCLLLAYFVLKDDASTRVALMPQLRDMSADDVEFAEKMAALMRVL